MVSVLMPALLLTAAATLQELPDTTDAAKKVEAALANHRQRWTAPPPPRVVCIGAAGRECWGGDWALGGWCLPNQSCHEPPDQLISILLPTAREYPHSGYVVGHAVFTLARHGRHLEALNIAQDCAAVGWWCQALQALVYQSAGRPSEASARLESFLAGSSDEALCEFQDATWLLGYHHPIRSPVGLPPVYEKWTENTCTSRLAASDTIFWLADPLYTVEGNDRQVEHLVRGIQVQLANEIGGAERMSNATGDQHHRVLITRRGPWDSYDRINRRAVVVQGAAYPIWASEYAAPYHFVPDFPGDGLEGFDQPTWDLMADLEDEGYKPSYGTFHLVPTQLARFRALGSPASIKVAAAAGVRGTPVEDAAESGYLVFTDAPKSFSLQLNAPFNEGRAVYLADAEAKPYVVSFEILTPGKIGWHREKIWPIETEGAGLSDLLLYRPTGLHEPDSLLAAAAMMLPTTEVGEEAGEVGLYWETYGLDPGTPVEFELEIEGEEGLIDRIRRLLPGGPQEGPGRIAWFEPAGENGFSRAVILDLRNLEEGSYTIVLRARQGAEEVEASRVVGVR